MTEFSKIYDEYFQYVYRYTLSLCQDAAIAEDVTQETFFKALKSIDKFNGKCKLQVWLCQIAKNTYFSYCEKEKSKMKKEISEIQTDSKEIEKGLINNETAFEIHKLLHKLQEPYKEVFTLRTFGELSFAQIGELFGKTESWSRVTYHRAKLKLKEDLV